MSFADICLLYSLFASWSFFFCLGQIDEERRWGMSTGHWLFAAAIFGVIWPLTLVMFIQEEIEG